MLTKTYPRVIDRIGELNPQLFREVKGRLKPRNMITVSAFSLIGQFFIYLYFKSALPVFVGEYSRYCTGVEKYYRGGKCVADLAGNVMTLKQLWWLDMFVTMSIIGTFVLLVVGSYLLVTDISKEESKGTLNFIRLSPQSAWTIWTGKMLGVPSLVYLFGALAIPLHLVSGLSANIPLHLILAFYLVLAASCFFFFSACLLLNNVKSNLGNFQGILVAGVVFFFLFITTSVVLHSYGEYSYSPFDWFLLLSPSTYLVYLVKSTFLPDRTIDYLNPEGLMYLNWYGKFIWKNALTGLGFILLNYGIWSFWLWQGLKRRFHNPTGALISKYHSYWLSACFIVFNLGFGLQDDGYYSHDDNLIMVQVFNLVLFLILIVALTPQRQTVQDWARYRHQNSQAKRNLLYDLLLGEKSPAVGAIALNVLIVTLYLMPTILLFPFEEEKSLLITGFILSGAVVILYATVMQLALMLKTNKRQMIANSTVITLMIIPFISLILVEAIKHGELNMSLPLLETITLFIPIPLLGIAHVSSFSIMGSSIGYIISLFGLNWQLKRVLNKAGMSETKMLLDSNSNPQVIS